ncbi:MAG: serine hydrolase [Bacteroidota bacterium]
MKKVCPYLLIVILFNVFVSCGTDPDNKNLNSYNWLLSTPEEQSLNSTLLEEGFTQAEAKGYIYSIIVIRNGKIAAERYFHNHNSSSYQTIRSVSKSFLSAFIGIAVEKGILRLDQKLVDLFPEYEQYISDARINNITIDHLLKMRSGFRGDDEFYFTFTYSNDWVKEILSSTLNFDPGTKMGYSTAATHLLCVVLARASGKTALEFANENFFGKCGFDVRDWLRDPQGNYFGGNDIYLTTRDMAVLGLIYLNNGVLDGKQIVPEDWVEKSLVKYSGSSTGSWGQWTKIGYGYLWWLGEVNDYKIFSALGHGGQFVFCVPSLNMIIATQSYPDSDWDQADVQERGVIDIIADYILPAAE